MINTIFQIREYEEDIDFDAFYEYQCKYDSKVTSYQLSGASPCIPKDEYRAMLREKAKMERYPFVVSDKENRAIGVSIIEQYVRIAKCHDICVKLWDQPQLTEAVLKSTLDRLLEKTQLVKMVVCRVEGWDTFLLNACRNIGMEEVGCIPDYLIWEGELYPEYIFAIRNK